MTDERPVFELGGGAAKPKGTESQAGEAKRQGVADVPLDLTAADAVPLTGKNDGHRLSIGLDACGYHPVVLFGNASSGKTSLLLSLLALLRTEPELACGLKLGEPILPLDTPYGRLIYDQAVGFYGAKTQAFINGNAAQKTVIDAPFFIPLIMSPEGKPELRFAFMESNGEWYHPDRDNDRLFPGLRSHIESFLATFQGPITFIHLIPYTQRPVYSANSDKFSDVREIEDASIAIKGALDAYQNVRPNKDDDRHLMLVTKWDAHDPAQVSKYDVLTDSGDEPFEFAKDRYEQAVTAFLGLSLRPDQRQFKDYCSGLIAGNQLQMPKRGDPLRDAILNYPKKLWGWLYQTALIQLGEHAVSPFPAEVQPSWLSRVLGRFF